MGWLVVNVLVIQGCKWGMEEMRHSSRARFIYGRKIKNMNLNYMELMTSYNIKYIVYYMYIFLILYINVGIFFLFLVD